MKNDANEGLSYRLPEEVTIAQGVLSGKWRMVVIWQLQSGTYRFGKLKRAIPGVTQYMLTLTLRDLEKEGIVKRVIYPEIPPRVEYSLTEYGLSILPLFDAMQTWGALHLKKYSR